MKFWKSVEEPPRLPRNDHRWPSLPLLTLGESRGVPWVSYCSGAILFPLQGSGPPLWAMGTHLVPLVLLQNPTDPEGSFGVTLGSVGAFWGPGSLLTWWCTQTGKTHEAIESQLIIAVSNNEKLPQSKNADAPWSIGHHDQNPVPQMLKTVPGC